MTNQPLDGRSFWTPPECPEGPWVLYYHLPREPVLLTVAFQFSSETHTIKCWILAWITWIHYAHGQHFWPASVSPPQHPFSHLFRGNRNASHNRSFTAQARARCPDILSYPSDFPISVYCACAHRYGILFLTLNNNISCICIIVRVGIDVNKTQSNRSKYIYIVGFWY